MAPSQGRLLLCTLLGALVFRAYAADPAATAPDKAVSNIIPSAGDAPLFLGIGDVNKTGPCATEIKSFCKDVTPGEGRLSACLTKRIRAYTAGNVVGRKIFPKCLKELQKYKVHRSLQINSDVPLARACKFDAVKMCKDVSDLTAPGSVLACLRDKKTKLTAACKVEVFRTQQEAVEDYTTDFKLNAACHDDIQNLCAEVEAGGGREMECLHTARIKVSWECQNQMFRSDRETGDDIRLSIRLFNKCIGDFNKFCKDIEPGQMRVQECLEDNMDEPAFTAECKDELDSIIEKRSHDFRLDTAMRDACESEVKDTCGTTLEEMDGDEKVKQTAINCLQQYKEELKSEACKSEVQRRMQRAARDIRFDEVLANACIDDRKKFCDDVAPGSARVLRCLSEHRTSLAATCGAALFDHEVRMAESIDFQYPMKKNCAWEMSTFCKSVPHGHSRVVRCLEEHLDHQDMSKECKAEVVRDMNRQAQDYRLNYRLNHACEVDVTRLCPDLCSSQPGVMCGGLVLQCLQDKQDNITAQACQDEVFYYELMEVSDFRNDVILAEACRTDVEAYCKDVEPGEGRVHTCLRMNRDKVSKACNDQETKLAAIEYRDIRLRPKLNKLCSEEKAVYCKETKPGKARVIKCLMENMAQPNFGEECKEELQKREDVMKSDYRYDIGVFTNCGSDVEAYCKDARSKLRGNATVLKCLVENFRSLGDTCQSEMSRAVRLALWDYKPGSALTATCDKDVDTQCPRGQRSKSGALFTIGVVGRCLSKALVEGKQLVGKCRDMVLVAAPKDARAYFDHPESTSVLVKKVAAMQNAAGLESVLVDPYARTLGSTVTVTGWVALACIISLIVVISGGGVMAYKRFVSVEKPHTLHVKMGDA